MSASKKSKNGQNGVGEIQRKNSEGNEEDQNTPARLPDELNVRKEMESDPTALSKPSCSSNLCLEKSMSQIIS